MAVLEIPVTNKTISVDTDVIPESMFAMALAEGLKVMLNKGMSKIAVKDLEGEELDKARAAAMQVAAQNLEKVMAGEIKKPRAAGASKVPGIVMTEARRLAKEVVKNEIRAAGFKVSHVEASKITAMANDMIATDPSFLEQAKANIEARTAKVPADEASAKSKLAALIGDLNTLESPKLKAKADAAKASKKSTLSAKQAGKVAPRKAAPVHAH